VPIVASEHPFRLPLRGHFFATHSSEGMGPTIEVKYLGTMSHQLGPTGTDTISSL
jgi:hypothetical protein